MTGGAARVVAHAKINLFLRVLGREISGYHQIETLFHRLDLADEVSIRVTGGSGVSGVSGVNRRLGGGPPGGGCADSAKVQRELSVECSGPELPKDGLGGAEQNIAYRAAALYQESTGWPEGALIRLRKRIPVGAGLGGGSADAGAVLRALNALAPRPLAPEALCDLAARVGSDVPFLTLEPSCALAWGRGERMQALSPPPERPVALFVPPFSVTTADAFAWMSTREFSAAGARTYDVQEMSSWDSLDAFSGNDLEAVVAARLPELSNTLAALRARLPRWIVQMTGSGSVVFAIPLCHPQAADYTLADLDAAMAGPGWRLLRSRTVARVVPVDVAE